MCPQPRYMPFTGIEPRTFQSTDQCSIHWAKPVSAPHSLLMLLIHQAYCFVLFVCLFLSSPKGIFPLIFRESGREGERQRNIDVRKTHPLAASCTHPTKDMPATKVHTLDQNRIWDLSVRRPMLYPLSQTGFGHNFTFDLLSFLFLFFFISSPLICLSLVVTFTWGY